MSNLVDRCVVVSDVGVFDSSGNIGHAIRDEVETNLNLPLDSLGLHGLTVKGNALFRRSRVRDPLTGAKRRISGDAPVEADVRSEEHTSELQSLMRISYAVFCLKKKT